MVPVMSKLEIFASPPHESGSIACSHACLPSDGLPSWKRLLQRDHGVICQNQVTFLENNPTPPAPKLYLFLYVDCLLECVYAHRECAWCPWRSEEGADLHPLGLKLQMVVYYRVGGVLKRAW